MIEVEETVGQRIKRIRLEKGLSQRAISFPGISYAYLSRVERDERAPSMKALRLFAAALGTTPQYLETGMPHEYVVGSDGIEYVVPKPVSDLVSDLVARAAACQRHVREVR